ncbi:MAG: phage terminase small subunit P27 family [Phycisphaerae bacterium]|jgi:P27 family predicted phage terminase small subunit
MGKRGRKPLPTTILIQHGHNGIYKRDNSVEVSPSITPLSNCPQWLNDEGKQKWFEFAPKMHKLGLLTDADIEPFARYCDTLALWHKARTMIEKAGMFMAIRSDSKKVETGEDGNETETRGKVKYYQIAPWVNIYNRLTLILCRMEVEFGLTPSARAGMAIAGKKNDNGGKNRFFGQSSAG